MTDAKKDELITDFTLRVISEQIRDLSKQVAKLGEKLQESVEKVGVDAEGNYEDLLERIQNLSGPGGDFEIGGPY